jgi:hypothetical protein
MPLRFVERTELQASTPLSDLQRARLAVVGPRYFGGSGAAQLASDDFDDDPMQTRTLMFCFEWKIVDGAHHRYDAWLYMTDSGTFFKAGTAEPVAAVIQFGLACDDPKLRGELGPAMVEARLLPYADGGYAEFAQLLAQQQRRPTPPLPIVSQATTKKAAPKTTGAPQEGKPAKQKAAPKKPRPGKATAKKSPANKLAAKKPAPRQGLRKKPAPKKASAKKTGAKRAARKAPKRVSAKKTSRKERKR